MTESFVHTCDSMQSSLVNDTMQTQHGRIVRGHHQNMNLRNKIVPCNGYKGCLACLSLAGESGGGVMAQLQVVSRKSLAHHSSGSCALIKWLCIDGDDILK